MKSLHLILFAISTTLCLAEDPKPNLDDPATLKGILAKAIDYDDLEYGDDENEDLLCNPGDLTPYTGWSKMVDSKGQVEALEQYKDGKLNGLEIMWYENGKKYEETNYKNGIKHGLMLRWYESGQKWSEKTYKDGDFHGPITKWREDGNMEFRHNYQDGKLHGLATTWDKEGNITSQIRYENGQQVEKIK